jgi:hypothetical protein
MNRATSLRVSLLVSLGLVSVACGGNTNTSNEEVGGSGGSDSGGNPSGGRTTNTGGKATTGGTGNVHVSACTSPKTDPVTGLVSCSEGYTHRPKAVACNVVAPAADAAGGANSGAAPPAGLPRADGSVPCMLGADEQCNQFELGYCRSDGFMDPPSCRSGCVQDADCEAGNICVCGDPSTHGGECQPSDCTTDADCGDGARCASLVGPCGSPAFHCQTAQDACAAPKDCAGSVCYFDEGTRARACFDGACGRPFLVEASARVAPVVTNSAWTARTLVAPSVEHLTAAERAALAEHWTRMGQMEHASIAAFARFNLQLLALGAPPELVDACTRALGDETAHTKLCFALASAYAGHAVGPGPLDVSHSLELSSLGDIVDLVIVEGCFGETSAALQALEAADGAQDPVIVAAYAQIARDEQRHAELAFQFVRWALAQDQSSAVRTRIQSALARPGTSDASTLAVALPCLQALLAAHPSKASLDADAGQDDRACGALAANLATV